VGDEGWVEVWRSSGGTIAVVQACGPDYALAQATALAQPTGEAADGLLVPSGELAVFSAAVDGDGEYADPLVPAEAGQVPDEPGSPVEVNTGLLIGSAAPAFRLYVQWCSELAGDVRFACWRLVPED
jgi:hypothetical protein